MKQIVFVLFGLSLTASIFVACEKDFVEPAVEKEQRPQTRGAVTDATHYYWYNGEKIPLTIDKSHVNIIAADGSMLLESDALCQQFEIQPRDEKSTSRVMKMKFKSVPANFSEYSQRINSLKNEGKAKYVLPFFERGGNIEPMGTSDIFYIKLKQTGDLALLTKTAQQYGVQIVREVAYMPLWYVVSIQGSCFANSIDASNTFYETGLFANVDPAFMFNFTTSSVNDPLFAQQWGLKNTTYSGIDINAEAAWRISTGKNVIVAVVDQGVELTHDDLKNNIYPYSFNAQMAAPTSLVFGDHGTAVAGIIAAESNNLNTVGVAYESKIMSISHTLSPVGDYEREKFSADLASGIAYAWQHGADVINCSWGDADEPNSPMHGVCLEEAIIDAMAQGRNNKGCVVVFATGNSNNEVDYPGNFHDDILTVGAIGNSGYRSSFSNYGTQLDVVAPGENIYTTDRSGSAGYSWRDYSENFGGTSAAAPYVSGVAALILSVHPEYTGLQVVEAIEASAGKVIGYGYGSVAGRLNGTWNYEMGYGLVDAYRALVLQPPCFKYYNNQTVYSNTFIDGCEISASNVVIKNGARLTIEAPKITIDNSFTVESGGAFTFGS